MLTAYESRQIREIEDWKRARPDIVKRRFGKVSGPLDWAIEKVAPYTPIERAFGLLDGTAQYLVDRHEVLDAAAVAHLEELQHGDLALSDSAADQVQRWAMGIAAAEGAATGVTGVVGLVADIPAVITLALRTVYKVGLCYGFDATEERQLALGILAVSGANSVADRTRALSKLQAMQVARAESDEVVSIESGRGRSGRRSSSGRPGEPDEVFRLSSQQITRQIGFNLAKRKVLQMVPFLGAVIGGSVNAWYMRDVGVAARRVFQEQWLRQNGKLVNVAA